ncbi:hypothetical protein DQ04_01601130 [Trypanosoma grayi]|uniref:hypothetical protein n=1 Tax=Trypanosoma grayi TaxID=71804 RepID=UPI0004F420DD|nr:hypothetical protein DQ04_01601130 [Trypanosoma grayi]KEG12588.1 hypothetical protein DQ04_01601130 [Trypanosoma grayi]
MWSPTAEVPLPSNQGHWTQHGHTNQSQSCDRTNYSPYKEFSHILEASHITFAGKNAVTQCTSLSDHPSPVVDDVTQGLLTPRQGCSRCAQINGIRESLKGVEASYLEEIAHLKRLIAQVDAERVDAANRAERALQAFDRSRQHNLTKDREIQELVGQLRQTEDKLQRSEYELASLRHRYANDIAFYHQRESFFFTETERCGRVALTSMESGWRTALQAKYVSIVEMGRREQHRSFVSHCELPDSPRGSVGLLSTCCGLSPSPMHQRSPSITRRIEPRTSEEGGNAMSTLKGGLLTELRQSKKVVDELNEKLKLELGAKEEQIKSLQQQLDIRDEGFLQLSREHATDAELAGEMQEEIDDMLRTEVWLTQSCERHRLEVEALEERNHVLQWLLRHHLASLPKKCLNPHEGTPEKQNLAPLQWTQGTFSPLVCNQGNRMGPLMSRNTDEESNEGLRAVVSQAVTETLQKVLQAQLLPLKLSVESIRTRSDELHASMKKAVEVMHHGTEPPLTIADEMKNEHTNFLSDTRQMLRELIASMDPAKAGDVATLRGALQKVARLTSHNSKIMDDKLNDILACQSAVATQLAMAAVPHIEEELHDAPPLEISAAVSPCKREGDISSTAAAASAGSGKASCESKQVRFELAEDDAQSKGRGVSGASFSGSTLPSHVWDVVESDDESIPPPPTAAVTRRTPYDIDEV